MDRRRSVRRQDSRRYKRPWFKKCKEYLRNSIAFLFSNVGIIGLVIGYTIAGAFMIQSFEGGKRIVVREYADRNRTDLVEKLWNLTLKINEVSLENWEQYLSIVDRELKIFQNTVVNLTRAGYDGGEEIQDVKSWSFAGAFLYSLTVITTIGYGNLWPHTRQGKIASIVYAIIGMPLFLLYLSNIGDVMAKSFKWIYANFCLCRWCPGVARRRAERRIQRDQQMGIDSNSENSNSNSSNNSIEMGRIDQSSSNDESNNQSVLSTGSYDVQSVNVPVTVCLMIMVGYICGGAILFFHWEYESGWSYLDASYFCFISLSTIGFGDFVPGDKIYGQGEFDEILELKFVFCSMYLMLGMALIAMCFNLMQEEVIHKIRTTIKTIKYIFRCR